MSKINWLWLPGSAFHVSNRFKSLVEQWKKLCGKRTTPNLKLGMEEGVSCKGIGEKGVVQSEFPEDFGINTDLQNWPRPWPSHTPWAGIVRTMFYRLLDSLYSVQNCTSWMLCLEHCSCESINIRLDESPVGLVRWYSYEFTATRTMIVQVEYWRTRRRLLVQQYWYYWSLYCYKKCQLKWSNFTSAYRSEISMAPTRQLRRLLHSIWWMITFARRIIINNNKNVYLSK